MAKDSQKSIEPKSELEKTNNGDVGAQFIAPVVTAGVAETTPVGAQFIAPSLPIAEGAPSLPSERRHIVKSATLVMLGNLGSSLMGMVRQQVVASFGDKIAGP